MSYRKAFTLIELLVVIAIIGILATISVVALQDARVKSRDAKRAADIKQLQVALELFFNDVGRYPTEAEWNTGQIYSVASYGTSTYMKSIPVSPTPADGVCSSAENSFVYSQTEDGNSYSLSFCLGGNTGTLLGGKKCAGPSGIIDHSCCIGSVNHGGQDYNMIEIGSQCWLDKNMDIGTMLCSSTPNNTYCYENQSNNSQIEKYCYYNNATDTGAGGCSSAGALYSMDEAMQYSVSEKAQDICPSGWHIPSDNEWYVLEDYLKNSGVSCDPNRSTAWGCFGANTRLAVGGSSGFNAINAGGRGFAGTGAFSYWGSYGIFWSSTISGNNAWMRWVGASGIFRYADSRIGVSAYIRCIKN